MTKHALIVGGTKGLGKIVASDFLKEGYSVSTIGRSESSLDSTRHYQGDVANILFLQETLAQEIESYGNIDSLVFLQRYRGLEPWQGEFSTTVTATKNTIEYLQEKNSIHNSSLVLVSSESAQTIVEDQPLSYHLGKSSLARMTQYFAVHLGKHHTRVNCVLPNAFIKPENEHKYTPEKMTILGSQNPLGRVGRCEDISPLILFLCSDQASFISGQLISVDGGASALR